MYYYESHMGGIYTSKDYLTYEELYCDSCGDHDTLIGSYDSFEDFLAGFANEISYYESGGYSLDAIIEDLSPNFDYTTALNIVKNNRKDVLIDKHKFLYLLHETLCPEHCTECPFDNKDDYSCKIIDLAESLTE